MPADNEQNRGMELLLANLPGMAYRCGADARCTVQFVSEGCRELLGLAPEDLTGINARDYEQLVHPDDRAAVRGRIDARLAQGLGFELRYRVRTATGGEKWVSDRGRGIHAADGSLTAVVGFLSDITELKQTEAKLREHDDMLTLAFSNARDMMLLARVEPGPIFRVQSVNRRYIDIVRAAGFKVTSEDLVGLTFSELRAIFGFPDSTWEPTMKRYRTVAETRRPQHYDEITEAPNGTFHGVSTISPMCDAAGICRFVLYTSSDITERKRAEAALVASEERFAKAFRAVPGAVFVTEFATGRVVAVNGGCERIYGYAPAECIGRTSMELGLWEDPADRLRLVDAIRRNGGTVRDMEIPGRTRDGRRVEVLVSCETVELNGQPHLVTIAHDITEQKRAEQALRESEAKFSLAFRASPGAMSISDVDTRRFVEVNDGFCQLLGFAREEMIGKTGMELNVWTDENDRRRLFERLLTDGSARDLEVTARHRDGHGITCLLNARVVPLGGKQHLITALHDITERKREEEERVALEGQLQQAQKLEALGQLAGGIAHDFNNILTGIIAYAELTTMDADRPDEVRKHLTIVRRAADRAADLVRQILTFSRKHTRERVPVLLGPVLREAIKLLRSSLSKAIVIEERIAADVPTVLADATQVHQIAMNLCTNAAHAMRRAPGRLAVKLERVQYDAGAAALPRGLEAGVYARLSVTDTGEGMDEATLARIFEPFFTTKGPGEGTGLGLSVVHGIVEDHDGMIAVRSRRGEGTTFEIYLPEHVAGAPLEKHETMANGFGSGQRILFIDDEAVIGGAVNLLLQRFGFRVTTHTDPRVALASFEAEPAAFDLVVTDLTMPQLDGIEVAKRILARRPEIPVLLATGHTGAWTPEALRALGVRGVLTKPLTSAKLTRAISEALNTSKR